LSIQELHALVDQIRNGPVDFEAAPPALRETFDGMLDGLPVSEGVRFESRDVGGVPTLTSRSPGADERSVLLYLHGGGYVAGSPSAYRSLWSGIAAGAEVVGVAPAYRLAPEHRFPAALDDALAAYRGLLDDGVEPGSIAIAGDSAGGGLAVALLVAARDAGLPMPSSLVLLSPWANPAKRASRHRDLVVNRPWGFACSDAYLGDGDPADPAFAPHFGSMAGLPPTYLYIGLREMLYDQCLQLAVLLRRAGVPMRYVEDPVLWHAAQSQAGLVSEAAESLRDVGGYLRRVFDGPRARGAGADAGAALISD